jgi:hypothetical protein
VVLLHAQNDADPAGAAQAGDFGAPLKSHLDPADSPSVDTRQALHGCCINAVA